MAQETPYIEDPDTSIYAEIESERAYQRQRWGNKTDDTINTPWMWVAYIAAYSTKWMVGSFAPLGEETVDDFRKKMIKTAAVAVAAVESIDRQQSANGKTFYE